MTDLRELLNQVADAPAPPSPLSAGQVFTAGRRRRRGRRLALGGAAAATALAATAAAAVIVPAGSSGPPVNLNLVYATRVGPNGSGQSPWQILNPKTGRYRTVDVYSVSQPTTDLRYAVVVPKIPVLSGGGFGPVDTKIGRYESATGEIRWYDLPVVPDTEAPIISPDGSYATVVGDGRLIVVELASGTTRSTLLPGGYGAPPPGHKMLPQGDALAWRTDSRHILLGNQILDLDGRVVGVQPLPDGSTFLASRPDRPGLLVRLGASTRYGLTDERGRLVAGADVWAEGSSVDWFVGWTGRADEPVLLATNHPPHRSWFIYATDLGGGNKATAKLRMVHRFSSDVREFVIAPLTVRSDAPHSATF